MLLTNVGNQILNLYIGWLVILKEDSKVEPNKNILIRPQAMVLLLFPLLHLLTHEMFFFHFHILVFLQPLAFPLNQKMEE